MFFREAQVADIEQIQVVRHSVKENVLSDPALVTDSHCEEYLTRRGKGWVCELDNTIVGFSIADLEEKNVWALFVDPAHEGKGIGRTLHNMMLDWYFSQAQQNIWPSTTPNTRAEAFYRIAGWKEIGTRGNGEIKFEMHYNHWKRKF